MTTAEIVALVLGSGGLGAFGAATVNFLSGRAAVRVDKFEAITNALNKRIDDLQEEVARLSGKLDTEQRQHNETRTRLRAALRHIRAMLAWLGTDRQSAPPTVPSALIDEL